MGAEGVLYVKVMTDEQIEVLRRQIAVYAIICEQLVEMHKAVTAQQDSLAGSSYNLVHRRFYLKLKHDDIEHSHHELVSISSVLQHFFSLWCFMFAIDNATDLNIPFLWMRLGGLYTDSLMVPGGHKITARQRWTPTSMQLQILESMFEQGHGTPSKQKIKEITLELSQHGHISETNVYNWFQNRRARSKRKQTAAPSQSNAEYELEAGDESPPNDQKKQHHQRSHNDQTNNDMHLLEANRSQTQRGYQSNDGSRSTGDSGRISYLENILSNQRLDHLMGSMDMPGSFSSFNSGENFDMMG